MKHLLVTGGAGFIGSTFCRVALRAGYNVTILDSLTYAGNLKNVEEIIDGKNCSFERGDITDEAFVEELCASNNFSSIIHLAAESHVDNSISGPRAFIETNITGTFTLLEVARRMWQKGRNRDFRFVHVSTDEVYGSLGPTGKFSESSNYAPNSPYSASKAASDLIARAWFHTYGLPTIITNCSNNYGPRQYPEKLIPVIVQNALQGKDLPIYGKGENIRDWIHVEDHARGILLALEKGTPGEKYGFGGNAEVSNIDLVKRICATLDKLVPLTGGKHYQDQIRFVTDRPGHDLRYAIDDSYAQKSLNFQREFELAGGLEKTILWYIENSEWLKEVVEKRK